MLTLTAEQIDMAAALLMDARLHNLVIDGIPEPMRPTGLADAYAIADRLAEKLDWEVGGWFCACTNPVIQRRLSLAEPYYARLFSDFIYRSPAVVKREDVPPMVLECELAFVLSRDLEARSRAYTRAEVEDAVASVHPAIEVVAGHLRDWPNQDVFSVIADNGTDGALVYGEGIPYSPRLDLSSTPVMLRIDGRMQREGRGSNVLGDPLAALVWLVNARSKRGRGLLRGHIHNTGTTTDIYWVEGDDAVAVADFGPLGTVMLEIA